jgi:hypothetical protein
MALIGNLAGKYPLLLLNLAGKYSLLFLLLAGKKTEGKSIIAR